MAKLIRNINSTVAADLTANQVALALDNYVSLGWVDQDGDRYKLNDKGRVRAEVAIQIRDIIVLNGGASLEEILNALPHIAPELIKEVLDVCFQPD